MWTWSNGHVFISSIHFYSKLHTLCIHIMGILLIVVHYTHCIYNVYSVNCSRLHTLYIYFMYILLIAIHYTHYMYILCLLMLITSRLYILYVCTFYIYINNYTKLHTLYIIYVPARQHPNTWHSYHAPRLYIYCIAIFLISLHFVLCFRSFSSHAHFIAILLISLYFSWRFHLFSSHAHYITSLYLLYELASQNDELWMNTTSKWSISQTTVPILTLLKDNNKIANADSTA